MGLASGSVSTGKLRIPMIAKGCPLEPISTYIIDILSSNPFGMDISATFTAITGWIEDMEADLESDVCKGMSSVNRPVDEGCYGAVADEGVVPLDDDHITATSKEEFKVDFFQSRAMWPGKGCFCMRWEHLHSCGGRWKSGWGQMRSFASRMPR
ncbi:hypothetical protein NE237_001447 [Protea cynaroides]|uniref:Uncharacterized protein n=1 Tax=Protea cynaroides TaxID=273540 RepID=A0A9Q0KU62_9MAGN|nr:hypothetical protein NE237_001447 [Protea cynaroides]